MFETLLASALLMGLAGSPHCLAMCGAACGALGGRQGPAWWLLAGRLLSYSAAGAVAAASVGSLAALGQAVAALRPLWTLVHVAALVLGLYLLWRGQQPAWLAQLGRSRTALVQHRGQAWHPVRGPARQAGAGLAWVAWPCGLLQSALLVAGLANGPWQGAGVMAAFATASAGGLLLGPAIWWRLAGPGQGGGAAGVLSATAAVRLAGLALSLASAWALGHGLWQRVAAWCGL